MRLINCQVKNVRIHSDISIDFSPQITLIEGANETGKSTLIEALHRTLFLKATATGAPIQALRSNLHLGHPTIQIRFEEKGEIYLLRKCFTGSSGQITLSNESNKSQLSGPPAEEYLADINSSHEGAEKIREIFQGKDNDFSVAVCLNAAAGLIVAEKSTSFKEGYEILRQHILSGEVIKKISKLYK